jgi:hypothetical protein
MINRIAVVFALLTSLNAFAGEQVELKRIESCDLADVQIEQDSEIFCDGDLALSGPVTLKSNGFYVQLTVNGAADVTGLTIDGQELPNGIRIWVRHHLAGFLTVLNEDADGLGWYITIEAGALDAGYNQKILNGANPPDLYVAGIKLSLAGTENTIARN